MATKKVSKVTKKVTKKSKKKTTPKKKNPEYVKIGTVKELLDSGWDMKGNVLKKTVGGKTHTLDLGDGYSLDGTVLGGVQKYAQLSARDKALAVATVSVKSKLKLNEGSCEGDEREVKVLTDGSILADCGEILATAEDTRNLLKVLAEVHKEQ